MKWLAGPAVLLAASVAALVTGAESAEAAWLKASSRHFEVYADTNEASLRRQASELERFDAVLRHVQHLPDHADAEFNKLTVYVLPSVPAVQSLLGMKDVAGIYLPRVSGSVAFTARGDRGGANDLSGRIVLFHEYTHHFMLGNFPQAYPGWFSEGYAEFASTTMEKNGDYWVGGAAQHRAYGLLGGRTQLTAAQLFAPPPRMSSEQTEVFYGRGWLLTHMIEFDPALSTSFKSYVTLLNTGTPSLKAATDSFGDLKALNKKMDDYLNQSKMRALTIKAGSLPAPKISVRPLTPGEAALIRLRMESTRGVGQKTAAPLYARAKTAMRKVGNDAVAQGWLAEMAYDAGDDVGAEAAADAALAADPASSQALLYKARVHLRRLAIAKSTDKAAWGEARSWIVRANRAQTNDAAALALFYHTFDAEGRPPSKGAVAGLYRAVDLVPQDKALRFAAARQHLIDGDADSAQAMLRPLAFDPHMPSDNMAARMLALLERGGTGPAALDLLKGAAEAADRDGGETNGANQLTAPACDGSGPACMIRYPMLAAANPIGGALTGAPSIPLGQPIVNEDTHRVEASGGISGGSIQASLGGRYAYALFELAEEAKSIDQVEQSLAAVRDALTQSPELRELTVNPLVARRDAVKAVTAAADQMGLDPTTRSFLGVLAEKSPPEPAAGDHPRVSPARRSSSRRADGGGHQRPPADR